MWLCGAFVLSHVPAFSDDAQCVTFEKHYQTSQVVYARLSPGSSGGAEIHCSLTDCPFSYETGEMLDVGMVFKKKYDLTKLEARIGCL